MKILRYMICSISAASVAAFLLCSAAPMGNNNSANLKVRIVNFKTCVEQSKTGKQEQAAFDALKKKMETSLEDKEKVLTDLATKMEDADYLDSLSPEAETELKRKFRALSQEYTQQQSQFFQALNQTNVKVIQKLNEIVAKAAHTVGQEQGIDLILNQEASFYNSDDLDISKDIVIVMDQMHSKESSDAKGGSVQ